MSENATKKLEEISGQLKGLPQEVADDALTQFAAKMEGFAEGFIAGKAYAEK
jgi:hypothetical protein